MISVEELLPYEDLVQILPAREFIEKELPGEEVILENLPMIGTWELWLSYYLPLIGTWELGLSYYLPMIGIWELGLFYCDWNLGTSVVLL